MGIFWALLTAGLYGSSDFSGGLATKERSPFAVILGAHGIGLVGVTVVALFVADGFVWRDGWLGVLGGVCGLVGVLLLYRRLAIGPMFVVAPISGVTSAAVPALWGLVSGERLSGLAWAGVALAITAIGLVSLTDRRSDTPVTPVVVIESLISGAGFGGFFIFLDATSELSSPWPVATARLATFALLLGLAFFRGSGLGRPGPRLAGLIAWAGLGDTAANVTFLWATEVGDLSVVAVLAGLYPIGTVLLARAVLGERMNARQFAGLGLAVAATALIALG